jgi:hypothetical protein
MRKSILGLSSLSRVNNLLNIDVPVDEKCQKNA